MATRRQMMRAVERCWGVACDADMPGVGAMCVNPDTLSQVRVSVFFRLLDHSLPVQHATPEEDWQGGDDDDGE